MGVMDAVPDPYTAFAQNVVIRQDDYTFWHCALHELAVAVNAPTRMAVVGTPGIGKSTTASLAIRLVLLQGKTVVYLHRTPDRKAYYIEFILLENGEVEI
jgi:ABC-type glutathione transport system ATPase component